jgi:endoglucanase
LATFSLLACQGGSGHVAVDAGPDGSHGPVDKPRYQPDTGPRVRVNQVGYLRRGSKFATLVTDATVPLPFVLRDDRGTEVLSGESVPFGLDASSRLNVHTLEFTAFVGTGDGFTVVADGQTSYPFPIGTARYQALRTDALNFFYLQRSGIAIDAAVAGAYARPAGHAAAPQDGVVNKGDRDIPCLDAERSLKAYGEPWTCDYTLDVTGGWYDAGNYAKMLVAGGISVWALQSLFERAKLSGSPGMQALADGSLRIPETGNGIPDLLDEARWELEFFLKMIVPPGKPHAGMAHLGVDSPKTSIFLVRPDQDPDPRYLYRPSTAATLNLAAVAAQGARLFLPYDAAFAGRLLAAARTTWRAATAEPALLASATECYRDDDLKDEFYWAAVELYLTTGEAEFLAYLESSPVHVASWNFTPWGFTWSHVGVPALLDLAYVPSGLPDRAAVVDVILAGAAKYLDDEAANGFGQPYRLPDGGYVPGSNSQILNNLMVLAAAYDLSGQARFRDGVLRGVDYIFGRNALNISYVKDYGTKTSTGIFSGMYVHQYNPSMPPAPPGAIPGGPTTDINYWDPYLASLFPEKDCPPQLCYVDSPYAWAVSEVALTSNSSLAWLAFFLADQAHGDE